MCPLVTLRKFSIPEDRVSLSLSLLIERRVKRAAIDQKGCSGGRSVFL